VLETPCKQTETKSYRRTFLNRRKCRTTERTGTQINGKKTQQEQTHGDGLRTDSWSSHVKFTSNFFLTLGQYKILNCLEMSGTNIASSI
jgi:hypothetical protein